MALRSGSLPAPGGRPGVHHVHDGAKLAGELPVHGYGNRIGKTELRKTGFVRCSSRFFAATGDMWTGMNDLAVPGFFSWSNEHMVTFTYWAPGEPDNHDGFNEDCVKMSYQVRRERI